MRGFLVTVVLIAVGIGIAGFAFGWFNLSTSPNDGKRNITLTFDQEKLKKDRDSVLAVFHTSRDTFQKQTETQLKGMDRNLQELKEKSKTASAETKVQLNEAINDLGNKTLVELKTGYEKAGSRIE